MHLDPSPNRDHLQSALIAFIEVYARRHQELNEQLRGQQISREEVSNTSRMLTAIKAFIEAQWLGIAFALPEEYHFAPRQLADLIEVEIVSCQQVTATSIETIPGQEHRVEALVLIDALLMASEIDDDDDEVESWFV
jgi:hypothetical protein